MRGCDKYQELISAMLDGELEEAAAAELHAHMQHCDDCRSLYEAFADVSAAMQEDLMEEPPEKLAQGVMYKIGLEEKEGSKRPFAFGRFTLIAACLAVVVFAAGRFGLLGGTDEAPPQSVDMAAMETVVEEAAPAEAPEAMFAMPYEQQDSTAQAAPESAAAPTIEPEMAPRPEPAPKEGAFTEGAPLWPGDAEPNAEESAPEEISVLPLLSDQKALLRIFDNETDELLAEIPGSVALAGLLDPAVADVAIPDIEPDYWLEYVSASGEPERAMEVWLGADKLLYTRNGRNYLAAGTAEEFLALLD